MIEVTGQRPRRHPPSVERVLAAARPAVGHRDTDAVLAVARSVVDDERQRLAAGAESRDAAVLGAEVVVRLQAFDGPGSGGPAEPARG